MAPNDNHNFALKFEHSKALIVDCGNPIKSFAKLEKLVSSWGTRELRMQRSYLTISDILHVTHFYFPFLY